MRSVAVFLLALGIAGSAFAQDEAPAHVAFAEAATPLDRESESVDAVAGEPVLPGDRLRTSAGRAELWFPDASSLALDAFTTVELLSPSGYRQTAGRTILVVARGTRTADDAASRYQVDTPGGSVVIDVAGEYKIAVGVDGSDAVELAVIRGSASLVTTAGTSTVRGGERAVARGDGPPSYPEFFNSARFDPFDAWAADRRDLRRTRTASSRYLPSDLQPYARTFDDYGWWDDDPTYGRIWYPTVAAGWRPYYNGYWRPLRRYGWTWVGLDVWGWPTHHYGRWGYRGARWFWIPDRRWGPAWVSWASAADYVSWCPLGFDNRPVVGFSLSVGNTWAGWVVTPRASFGGAFVHVRRHAIDGRRVPRYAAFATHAQAPFAPRVRVNEGRRSAERLRPVAPTAGVAVPRDPRFGGSAGRTDRGPGRFTRTETGARGTPDDRSPTGRDRRLEARPRAGSAFDRAGRPQPDGNVPASPEVFRAPRRVQDEAWRTDGGVRPNALPRRGSERGGPVLPPEPPAYGARARRGGVERIEAPRPAEPPRPVDVPNYREPLRRGSYEPRAAAAPPPPSDGDRGSGGRAVRRGEARAEGSPGGGDGGGGGRAERRRGRDR